MRDFPGMQHLLIGALLLVFAPAACQGAEGDTEGDCLVLDAWRRVSSVGRFFHTNSTAKGWCCPETGTPVNGLSCRNISTGGEVGGWHVRIIGIAIPEDAGVTGMLPASFSRLTALQLLYLRGNALGGTLDQLPSSLTYLDIGGCGGFNGPLDNLATMKGMKVLDLSGNAFNGSIPVGMGNLTQLQTANFTHNQLQGTLPPSLGRLHNLRTLSMTNNRLSGGLGAWLGELGKLRTLALTGNSFSGPLGEWLGSLKEIVVLELAGNTLGGSLPSALCSLASLTTLILNNNEFVGTIPASLGQLQRLGALYLNRNRLTGPIPPSLAWLARLELLELAENQLEGPLPENLGDMRSLTAMFLDNNRLNCSIPPSLQNLTALVQLNLGANNFTGSIPVGIGRLTKLTLLDLQNNALSSSIPSSIDSLRLLTSLRLSGNRLTGSVPLGLGQLGRLRQLSLNDNQFSGNLQPVLDALAGLKSLATIDLSSNLLQAGAEADGGEWHIKLPFATLVSLADNQLGGVLTQLLVAKPALVDIRASSPQLSCPLPRIDFANTVLRKPSPGCLPNLTPLAMPVAACMAVLLAVGCCVFCFCRREERRPQRKLFFFSGAYVARLVGFASAGLFLSNALHNLNKEDSPACEPINHRSVFEPFLPVQFTVNGSPFPPEDDGMCCETFPAWLEKLGTVFRLDSPDVQYDISAFVGLCNDMSGCRASKGTEETPAWLVCAAQKGDGGQLLTGHGRLPVFESAENLIAFLVAVIFVVGVKEFVKVAVLLYAARHLEGKVQPLLRRFAASSPFCPLLVCCGKNASLSRFHRLLVLHDASSGEYWLGFVAEGLLHSLPLLVLNIYFYQYVLETGLDPWRLASIPIAFASTLAHAVQGLWALTLRSRAGRKARGKGAKERTQSLLLEQEEVGSEYKYKHPPSSEAVRLQ